tara:strand:+ start:9188 stop:10297 length:1110 start_codon:yes stop_codon:yes gene_type:complete
MTDYYKPTPGTILGGEYSVNEELGEGRYCHVVDGYCVGSAGAASVGVGSDSDAANSVAIKVFRTGSHSMECWQNESRLLAMIGHHPNIIKLLRAFAEVTLRDNTPYINPCIAYEKAGPTVSDLIKYCNEEHGSAIPLEHTKKIMNGLMSALAHIHSVGIIHSDVKPGNLLLDRPIDKISGLDFDVKLIDFGSSVTKGNDPIGVGTVGYLAPEILFECEYTTSADIWSAFVSCFRMITGEELIDVYGDSDIVYGDDCQCTVPECDSSDDSGGDDDDVINYRTLALLEKFLGPADKHWRKRARKYYNSRRKLKNNPDIKPITLGDLLRSNFEMTDYTAIEQFLLLGIKYNPSARITATDTLNHKFLQADIV